jgi:hypothetical protein
MTRINNGFNALPVENLEPPAANDVAKKQPASEAPVQNEIAAQTTTPSELTPAPLTDPLTKNLVQEQLATAAKKKATTVAEELPKESLSLNFTKVQY